MAWKLLADAISVIVARKTDKQCANKRYPRTVADDKYRGIGYDIAKRLAEEKLLPILKQLF